MIYMLNREREKKDTNWVKCLSLISRILNGHDRPSRHSVDNNARKKTGSEWMAWECKSTLNSLASLHTYWQTHKLEALKRWVLHSERPPVSMATHFFPKIWPHLIPSPSIYRETGSGGLKTRQQQQERLNTKYNTALFPSSYFIFCLSLLSRQLWLVNICRGSNLYLRKTQERKFIMWKSNKYLFPCIECTFSVTRYFVGL